MKTYPLGNQTFTKLRSTYLIQSFALLYLLHFLPFAFEFVQCNDETNVDDCQTEKWQDEEEDHIEYVAVDDVIFRDFTELRQDFEKFWNAVDNGHGHYDGQLPLCLRPHKKNSLRKQEYSTAGWKKNPLA
jgi:hypothetical protein